MMAYLQIFPLVIVALMSGFAVLNYSFNDNLMQRIGLSGICIGACLRMAILIGPDASRDQSITILLWGLAAFGVGTMMKVYTFRGK